MMPAPASMVALPATAERFGLLYSDMSQSEDGGNGTKGPGTGVLISQTLGSHFQPIAGYVEVASENTDVSQKQELVVFVRGT